MFTLRYYMWLDAHKGKGASNIGEANVIECGSVPATRDRWLFVETPKGCVMLDLELVARIEYEKSE